jgi:SAM-dependent methyltransferase
MNQRLLNERRYHDAEAASRAVTFAHEPRRLRFADSDYIRHVPWISAAVQQLGHVAGRRVLDLGCGHGMAAVILARRGAMVSACDLSPGYVAEAQQRATANEAIIDFTVAAGERLPFASESFDAIWGHAILHHLDLPVALPEIRRVLKPGGVAVFCEPWNGNPLIRWLRHWRRHSDDERSLTSSDIALIRNHFNVNALRRFQWNRYIMISLST